MKKLLYCEGGQTLEQVPQKGSEVSVLGAIQHQLDTILGNLL